MASRRPRADRHLTINAYTCRGASELSQLSLSGFSGNSGDAQVRTGGEFFVVDEGEHRLARNAEHGDGESASHVVAVVGIRVMDDVAT